MADVDWEAEGLLEGLEGEDRAAREKLLEELLDDGVELEELRTAVAEDRLALLPVERILSGGDDRLTIDEVAERAGVDRDFIERDWRALGMALAEDDARIYTERDVEAAKRVQALLDGGIPEEAVLEIARLLGMTMSQLAAANRRVIADAFLREGDTEYDAAQRFAAAAEAFLPLIGETLSYVLALHLREQIRHDAFGLAELSSGPGRRGRRGHGLLRRPGRLHAARRDAGAGGARERSPDASASSPRPRSSRRCGW